MTTAQIRLQPPYLGRDPPNFYQPSWSEEIKTLICKAIQISRKQSLASSTGLVLIFIRSTALDSDQ
jgi:hypothetical protein